MGLKVTLSVDRMTEKIQKSGPKGGKNLIVSKLAKLSKCSTTEYSKTEQT